MRNRRRHRHRHRHTHRQSHTVTLVEGVVLLLTSRTRLPLYPHPPLPLSLLRSLIIIPGCLSFYSFLLPVLNHIIVIFSSPSLSFYFPIHFTPLPPPRTLSLPDFLTHLFSLLLKSPSSNPQFVVSVTAYQMVGMQVKEMFMFVCQNCTVITIETTPTGIAV